jgi:hypothetical protein
MTHIVAALSTYFLSYRASIEHVVKSLLVQERSLLASN